MKRGQDILVIVTGLVLLTGGLVFAVKVSLFDLWTPRYGISGAFH